MTIPSPDETLRPLFEACRSNPADACLPLCRRVLEIVDQFQGPESIEQCQLFPLPDAGTEGGAVSITYRPSSCE